MSITAGHLYGWKQEEILKGNLETLFGEPLRKFEDRYSKWDFETDNYLIELKSRQRPYRPNSFDTYLVPVCKTIGLTKELVIFYYFEETRELFYIIYDEHFVNYTITTNSFGQKHFLIPREHWTKV
jgi:hypothetical protein